MIITKIKLTESKNRVVIQWEEIVEGQTNQYSLNCAEEPRQGLYDALNGLLSLAIATCHLCEDTWKQAAIEDRAFVSGVSLKYPNDGAVGINITAQLKDENSGMAIVINTPYLGPDWLGPADEAQIDRLCDEAEAYIKGERAVQQLSLLEAA